MALTPERRAALVAARSAAVVRDHFGVDIAPADWVDIGGGGAAASDGDAAWVAPADGAPVALGAALAWAMRQRASQLHLVVVPSDGAGPLGEVARRGGQFVVPPRVWALAGIDLTEVAAADAEPVLVPPPITAESMLLLEQAGVDVVVEEGVVIGELASLLARPAEIVTVDGAWPA
ncbi:MAG: hypothetical protein JJE52_07255 [Acidimicrobiia bacterium]|nr:hypothetical protein [Acidimicrobiia bacterium]